MSKNKMHIGGDTWKSKRKSYIGRNGTLILSGKLFDKEQTKIVGGIARMGIVFGASVGALITYLIMR